MGDWIAFWNSDNSIYVNARHRDVHYRTIADDIARYVPGPTAVVLDYGCGDALHADRVAAVAGQLILTDAAASVRERLTERFRDCPTISVRAPGDLGIAGGTLDLVVMHSVAQYLGSDELDALLATFRRLMKPGTLLVVGDVMSPDAPVGSDVTALLRFAAANRFLGAALIGLARTLLSNYIQLRSTLGLSRYTAPEMIAKLTAAGFSAERARVNIGHDQARMTFLARLPTGPRQYLPRKGEVDPP
jgi:SAM-dependent methyltransferase